MINSLVERRKQLINGYYNIFNTTNYDKKIINNSLSKGALVFSGANFRSNDGYEDIRNKLLSNFVLESIEYDILKEEYNLITDLDELYIEINNQLVPYIDETINLLDSSISWQKQFGISYVYHDSMIYDTMVQSYNGKFTPSQKIFKFNDSENSLSLIDGLYNISYSIRDGNYELKRGNSFYCSINHITTQPSITILFKISTLEIGYGIAIRANRPFRYINVEYNHLDFYPVSRDKQFTITIDGIYNGTDYEYSHELNICPFFSSSQMMSYETKVLDLDTVMQYIKLGHDFDPKQVKTYITQTSELFSNIIPKNMELSNYLIEPEVEPANVTEVINHNSLGEAVWYNNNYAYEITVDKDVIPIVHYFNSVNGRARLSPNMDNLSSRDFMIPSNYPQINEGGYDIILDPIRFEVENPLETDITIKGGQVAAFWLYLYDMSLDSSNVEDTYSTSINITLVKKTKNSDRWIPVSESSNSTFNIYGQPRLFQMDAVYFRNANYLVGDIMAIHISTSSNINTLRMRVGDVNLPSYGTLKTQTADTDKKLLYAYHGYNCVKRQPDKVIIEQILNVSSSAGYALDLFFKTNGDIDFPMRITEFLHKRDDNGAITGVNDRYSFSVGVNSDSYSLYGEPIIIDSKKSERMIFVEQNGVVFTKMDSGDSTNPDNLRYHYYIDTETKPGETSVFFSKDTVPTKITYTTSLNDLIKSNGFKLDQYTISSDFTHKGIFLVNSEIDQSYLLLTDAGVTKNPAYSSYDFKKIMTDSDNTSPIISVSAILKRTTTHNKYTCNVIVKDTTSLVLAGNNIEDAAAGRYVTINGNLVSEIIVNKNESVTIDVYGDGDYSERKLNTIVRNTLAIVYVDKLKLDTEISSKTFTIKMMYGSKYIITDSDIYKNISSTGAYLSLVKSSMSDFLFVYQVNHIQKSMDYKLLLKSAFIGYPLKKITITGE